MRTWGLLAAFAALQLAAGATAAGTRIPPLYSNCKHLNAKYRHGLGRVGAHDKTTGVPVTNFTRNTRLYNLAIHYNRGLDRDHDGIACENHG